MGKRGAQNKNNQIKLLSDFHMGEFTKKIVGVREKHDPYDLYFHIEHEDEMEIAHGCCNSFIGGAFFKAIPLEYFHTFKWRGKKCPICKSQITQKHIKVAFAQWQLKSIKEKEYIFSYSDMERKVLKTINFASSYGVPAWTANQKSSTKKSSSGH